MHNDELYYDDGEFADIERYWANDEFDDDEDEQSDPIEALAIEAGLISSNSNGFDSTALTPAQLRFAALIIRECAALVEGFEICREVADGEYTEYEASTVLHEHFGVGT
jgi:hypothetical protein